MNVRAFKITRVTPGTDIPAEPVQVAAPDLDTNAAENDGSEVETGGRAWRARCACPYCGRTNRVWVSRHTYYWYSCWNCGNTFCV